ncbi:hypothetical protein BGZ65_007332 [Modicella reniformis]|uniref:Uncharacterized protein n=1 Tax=Modicella reniformis TaxID=1440133 RepID=A0A9P6SPK2_9FUNG|nr:hypothetical protein BGZ65_007332 [Modicella reniformis]
MTVTGSAILDFVIGFAVSLIASVMNAAGLNLLKLDHVRNSALPTERQKNECGRPLWHIGLYLYITSQLAGSTIALNFLKTQWVAPLGSIALIFNFVFAKMLVGTQITRMDVYGTIVVMFSVIWIVVFGGMNSAGDIEETMTLTDLKALFARVVFVIYFSILNTIIFAFLALGIYAYWVISLDDESGQLRKKMKTKLTKLLGTNRFARASGLTLEGDEGLEAEARDLRLRKVVAMIMSACGGLLASETLLLAKSGVKLITSTLGGQNQFTDNLSYFILFVLVFTAILQVYCLNTGLKLYDSVLVVPTFYGFYTAFGLINSTIYLNQLGDYEAWVLLLVLLGIGALIYGVKMLSAPKPDQTPSGGQLSALDNVYDDDDEEDSHEMEQRSKSGKGSEGRASRKSTISLKKKTSRRQSHVPRRDEENDTPSLYGSHRGILEMDDISSEISSSVGGSSTRARGMSFVSKTSFQSDPFRTPKDRRSINGAFGTGIGDRRGSLLTRELDGALTHVLVDTTDDLHDSEDGVYDVREQEHRRQSMLQSSLKTLTMGEKPATGGGFDHPQAQTQKQRPRIDTTIDRTRRESARFSPSPGMMSPSQFTAHLIETSQQSYQQDSHDDNENDDLGAIPTGQMQKGHSVRWSTGSSKIDQAFEDLNPFKALKSNRDSVGTNAGFALSSSSTSSSLPSSPRPPADVSRPGHGRHDSLTGLPSEWDVPGRKKRHSMRFGETARPNIAPGSPVSTSSLSNITVTTTETPGSPLPSTPSRAHSFGLAQSFPMPFSPGEKMANQAAPASTKLEVTPSPRTSRIMSSPEIALGPLLALVAAVDTNAGDGDAGSQRENHVVSTGVPSSTTPPTFA